MTGHELSSIPTQRQEWPGTVADLVPAPDHGEESWTGRDRLTGMRALVTGGDSGIGRAVAITFVKEGASVVITHLPQEREDARATKDIIDRLEGTCHLVEADLRGYETTRSVAEETVDRLGGLDVLVANAGYQMARGEIEAFPPEQIVQTFETNVFSAFWLARELASTLEQSDNGSIIITSSNQAYNPSDHLLDYAASKAALTNLAANLAADLGPRGIRVNSVEPGPIWTPLIPATLSPERVRGFGTEAPLGRAGHPVEVAAAFVFLASAEASYVTGTVLGVTGGKPVF